MEDKRPYSMLVASLLLALMPVLLGSYIAGYFWLGTLDGDSVSTPKIRVYEYPAMVHIFKPMAKAESFFTGQKVLLASREPAYVY